MAIIEFVMPKMGESVMEGTIIKWLKNVGDYIKQDEMLLEVATDKVDTEIPSTLSGKIVKFLANPGDVVKIGSPIALIETEIETNSDNLFDEKIIPEHLKTIMENDTQKNEESNRFYSPLVLNIARTENISLEELNNLTGSGIGGRVTKEDILSYIKEKKKASTDKILQTSANADSNIISASKNERENYFRENNLIEPTNFESNTKIKESTQGYEILEMDRTRKLIAQRMLESKRISAHVTSFVEADITNLVHWRNKMKHEFMQREGCALTLTPLFIEAIAHALKDFPKMNASVENDKIIIKKNINIGMAVALPDGNLIVPVIKNADQLNLVGLTKKVNELAKKARENKLEPDDLTEGTYTMSNVGQFGNIMGTPIIVQPQVGIMAFGAVQKKPAVVETPFGDAIGIRHIIILSHSYDHRIIDGALGGMFVRRVADYLEKFDTSRTLW
jgi:2-oxoglutarate dehydrogenase E2 component (dihydrolipoamide succinyltransferase)